MSDYAEVAATAADNLPPADPGEAGAAATPAPAAPDDAGVVPSSGEGAAPTWTGPSQEEWQSYQQRQAELEQQLSQPPPTPQFDPYTGQPLYQQAPELPEPWDPDYSQKMAQYLDYRDQQVIDRALGPVQPFMETAVNEQARGAMTEALTALKGEVEGFDDSYFQAAEMVGNGYLGETNGDPYAALRKGAEFVTQMVKAEREAAVTAYKESLQRGNGQPEPGASGGGIPAPAAAGSYAEIAELFSADPDRPQRAFG